MITDLIINFCKVVFSIVLTPIAEIPVSFPNLSSHIATIAGQIGGQYGGVIGWFPWTQLGLALVALGVWTLACHAYRLVLWCLGVIHVSGQDG